ncbi:MAG: cytochrome-c oxidase, cbb3-type subunit I [Candidatus Omnitrophica bacterium]|jgi:cytochrome c oxidase cbb3-type subunit I/II|nr:cytochrome-c oxidase, cbb3-type subunit I [Candidatus Omnitrophota bacterium]
MENSDSTASAPLERFSYDDTTVKHFALATMIWGAVAMLVGVIIALQLANYKFNLFDLPWLSFGRLRPLHTNAAIFAFAGNAIFAGVYHSSQRLLKTRIYSNFLSALHFWGWQLIIVSAALTLPLGITTGKEYAELEWPIDIMITVVWVAFAVNFFGMLFRRRERHLYVALWFYIASIVTVAVLHIVNSIAIPVGLFKSYPVYAGVQDALVQWWYGHNAVAFFLTTPFLGLMYYYLPKAVNRPIYSYRLSIIHFWALVFIYIWTGPHHLLHSAMPDWAQTVGMVFSIVLLAPSWGGMINGLLTLRGAWDRVRREPILKFLVASITFYGMATFEGPLLSIKSVNALAHFTDWIVGHVHSGVLGWNGFMIAAMLYYLVPRLWNSKLYSDKLANLHFWLGTAGIVLYMTSMWAAGVTQGLMWRAVEGVRLVYPDFVETVTRIAPLYWVRVAGGVLYLTGYLVMLFNLFKTISLGKPQPEPVYTAPRLMPFKADRKGHRLVEGLPALMIVLVVISVLVGSVIEILPTLLAHRYYVPKAAGRAPYTALQLAGRDIYIREGCYTCHSQMVRSLPEDILRYGERSKPEEFIYDHPFQWGSRRIGPDLARVGGKYPDSWHYYHMKDPRKITPNSIMPAYPELFTHKIDYGIMAKKARVMKSFGAPYSYLQLRDAALDAERQAAAIAEDLKAQGASEELKDKEILAVIAYLQTLKPMEEKR